MNFKKRFFQIAAVIALCIIVGVIDFGFDQAVNPMIQTRVGIDQVNGGAVSAIAVRTGGALNMTKELLVHGGFVLALLLIFASDIKWIFKKIHDEMKD